MVETLWAGGLDQLCCYGTGEMENVAWGEEKVT